MCKKQIGDILANVPKGKKDHNNSWLLNICNIEMKNFHYMMTGRFTCFTSLKKKFKKSTGTTGSSENHFYSKHTDLKNLNNKNMLQVVISKNKHHTLTTKL